MEAHYISLKPLDGDWVELRHGVTPKNRQSMRLPLAEIRTLLERGNLSYYVSGATVRVAGERLFCWLDGTRRWLSQRINECPRAGLVLAIATEGRLRQLPWEVLHDGQEFLVERRSRPIVPIRWIEREEISEDAPSLTSGLQVVFMATSPEGVRPVLDFEEEEANILEITKELPLALRVEESGNLEELGKMWRRFAPNTFRVFHLSAHALIEGDESHRRGYFVTETLTGEPKKVTSEELMKLFENRFPRLMFLSGCGAGQSGGGGAVSSMGETLVREGMPAVLCWRDSARGSTANLAAAQLYERLAEGFSLAEAMRSTWRELRRKGAADWHLMRLYADAEAWGPLIVEPGDYVSTYEPVQMQFLDAKKQVRVATAEGFVGRRRVLQDCLRQLRKGENLGLMIHGLGGVGKSTVAARLLERLVNYIPVVIYGRLSVEEVERCLSTQCLSSLEHRILQEPLSAVARLTKFLQVIFKNENKRICFVVDNFEVNLEAVSDGEQVLQSNVVDSLTYLLRSVAGSKSGHRVIITSRYDVRMPELDGRVYRKAVGALGRADLEKKCRRLKAFGPGSVVEAEFQEKGKDIADGNPRLLEWLDQVLVVEGLDQRQILELMGDKEVKFREDILAEELLKRQSEGLKTILWRLLVFELGVPKGALLVVCDDISEVEEHCRRAVELGLLEVSDFHGDICYRVPRILAKLLPADEIPREVIEKATQVLYELWGEEVGMKSEEQLMEMYRLGKIAENEKVCIAIGSSLCNSWQDEGRYREAIPVARTVLEMQKRYLGQEHRDVAVSINKLAVLYSSQGRYSVAEPLYLESLEMTKRLFGQEHSDVATSINNLALLYDSQGRYGEAEPLFLECLKMKKRLLGQEHPQVAKIIHNLASIYHSQGRYGEAEPLYLECLEMRKRLLGQEHPHVAVSINNLALLYHLQGRYNEAESLYLESLEMKMRVLGQEHPAVARSKANLAGVYSSQGRYSEAEPLYLESLEMTKRLVGQEHPDVASSINNLASCYSSQGRYSEAEPLYIISLEIRRRLLGQEHADTAQSINNIASLYSSQGRYSEAEPLYLECLEMTKRLLGQEHPDVAVSINNLASLYDSQGRYSEAEPLYVESLEMGRRLLGQEHPAVAKSMNNLASCYKSQGRYSEAEPLYLESLEIRRRLLGQEHPDTAQSINNLASLHSSQGRYSEAEPLYVESLEIRKRLLGQDHPDVATAINNLASLYYSQGRYSKAEPLYLESLEMTKRLLGEEHPHVAQSTNDLALIYYSQGRYSEAEPLYLESLEMTKRLLGQEHPDVAIGIINLASLYDSQGRYSEAEPLYVEGLEMGRRLLGQEHPTVATSINNLASFYESQGRYNEAEPLYVECLEMRKRLLGQEHPAVARSINSLAGVYESQGRYGKAEPLYVESLEMTRRLLGQEHPLVATIINNLALIYYSQKRYSEAEPLYLESLEMRKRLLGQDHPDVAQSINNLASLYYSQGRYSEAEPLCVECLQMRKRLLGQEHPDVVMSTQKLADVYKAQGRLSEAEPLYLECLKLRKPVSDGSAAENR